MLASEGKFDDIDAQIYICHYNSIKRIHRDVQKKPDDLVLEPGEHIGIWYYGESGTGKTHTAINDYPDNYRKIANNKWWDGYNGEDNVLMDDLDKAHAYMGYHLKIWADRYAFIAEVKGGSSYIRPKRIIVTSNYKPEDIWTDVTTLGPINRRFKFIHLSEVYKPPQTSPEVPSPIVAVPSATSPNFVLPGQQNESDDIWKYIDSSLLDQIN
jgi:hypothetical protein